MPATAPRAILLDLDNTLIDRDAALRACLRHHTGLTHELDPLLELDRSDNASLTALSIELHQRRPSLAPTAQALATQLRHQIPSFITPNPTITTALTQLAQAGLRLALISNGGPTQRLKLAAAQIPSNQFELMQISSEFGHEKPHPAIFQATLTALNLPASATLMIGDNPQTDIVGAHPLNIPTCWISHNRSYPTNCPKPTFTAHDFPAAVSIILDQ